PRHTGPGGGLHGQGSPPQHRAGLRAVVGHGQRAARHADAAQGARRPRPRGRPGQARGQARVTLEAITFWALGALLLASALMVVLTKNLFHSVLYLALSLTVTAGIYLALDAEFLAAVQLLLYAAGGVPIVLVTLAAVLFAIGLFGVITRRNTIGILLGIELMLNAVNINLVAFARFNADVVGMIFTLFTISITVAEVALGLAITILVFRIRRTVVADHLDLLKG